MLQAWANACAVVSAGTSKLLGWPRANHGKRPFDLIVSVNESRADVIGEDQLALQEKLAALVVEPRCV